MGSSSTCFFARDLRGFFTDSVAFISAAKLSIMDSGIEATAEAEAAAAAEAFVGFLVLVCLVVVDILIDSDM
jgi:hypothetical protein